MQMKLNFWKSNYECFIHLFYDTRRCPLTTWFSFKQFDKKYLYIRLKKTENNLV